jgi:carbon monoxide dehydrogenase subunit G
MHLKYRINKPLKVVFDCLTDMNRFTSLHPVVYKMEKISEDRYLVYEKLLFISFTYPVVIKSNTFENTISMEATVLKFTKITIKFCLQSENEITIVNEKIHISKFLLFRPIIKSIFKKQHIQLFKNIENTT